MSVVSDAIRALIRERARQCCEYCHLPDQITTYGYHVDHIIPIKHGGNSEPANLAWACMECNINKGRDVASYDELDNELVPLFNPRTQNWDEHFEMDYGYIHAKTAIGRITLRVLSINEPDLVETRRNLIDSGFDL